MKRSAAVGFDLGDTLCEYAGVPLNWEREYPAALAAVARACALDLSEARLRGGCQLLARYNTRLTPRPQEREYSAELVFQELLQEWGAPPDALARCIATFFAHFRQTLRVFPDTLVALARLQKMGVESAVLTDVPYGMPKDFVLSDLAAVGLPFSDERVITSTEVGHRKPHVGGFALLARRLGVPCDRLVYVGNERKDVTGGNAAGCRTVLLWRSSDEPPGWGQTAVVRSLAELHRLPLAEDW